MHSGKNNHPRGYTEVSDFVEQLWASKLSINPQKSLEEYIDDFLQDAFQRELSVCEILLAKLEECFCDDYKSSVIAYVLSRCNIEHSGNSIVDHFQNSEVPDSLRKRLLPVLAKFPKVNIQPLMASFKNKEAVVEHALKSLLKVVGEDGEELEIAMQYLGDNPPDFYKTLIGNLTSRSDPQSIWLLGALAETPEEEVAEAAIKSLSYRKSPLAYEMIDNLIIHRESKADLRQNSLDRLAQQGIAKRSYRVLSPHKSYLSWIDGHGNQMLLVSRKVGQGRLTMVTFIVNEKDGFRDCSSWPDISNFELESMLREWEREIGIKQVDYTVAVGIIEDCLWNIAKNNKSISPSFLSARRIFGSQKLAPKPYAVDIENLGIRHVREKLSSLLDDSHQIIEMGPFCEWWLDTQEVHQFIKERRSLSPGKKIRKDVLNQFIKTIFEKNRKLFSRRFLMTADYMHRISPRGYCKQIEIALALHLAFSSKDPLKGVPFLQELAVLNIKRVQASLDGENVKAVC